MQCKSTDSAYQYAGNRQGGESNHDSTWEYLVRTGRPMLTHVSGLGERVESDIEKLLSFLAFWRVILFSTWLG